MGSIVYSLKIVDVVNNYWVELGYWKLSIRLATTNEIKSTVKNYIR